MDSIYVRTQVKIEKDGFICPGTGHQVKIEKDGFHLSSM